MGIGVGSVTLPGAFANSGLTIESYSEEPYVGDTAELNDEWGDVVETARFGADAGITVCEATLVADCAASSVPSSVTLGGSGGIESVGVSTSQGDFPKITLRWYSGLSGCDAGATYTAALSAVEGKKKAQNVGGAFSPATGAYIQSSSLNYSCQFSPLWNVAANGAVSLKGYAFTNGRAETSLEVAGGGISVTSGSGWDVSSGPSMSKTYNGFPTASASATKTLTRNSTQSQGNS